MTWSDPLLLPVLVVLAHVLDQCHLQTDSGCLLVQAHKLRRHLIDGLCRLWGTKLQVIKVIKVIKVKVVHDPESPHSGSQLRATALAMATVEALQQLVSHLCQYQ